MRHSPTIYPSGDFCILDPSRLCGGKDAEKPLLTEGENMGKENAENTMGYRFVPSSRPEFENTASGEDRFVYEIILRVFNRISRTDRSVKEDRL